MADAASKAGRIRVSGAAGFDPSRIIEAFNRHGIEYVVIGGFAAELHDVPIRPTQDIDFTPSTTRKNLERVSSALKDLRARVRAAGVPGGLAFDHDARSLGQAAMLNLTCPAGDFDLSFRPSGTEGYEDLARDAVTVMFGEVPVRVASLADVVRSKTAAGRPKDLETLPTLRGYLLIEQERDDRRQT